MLTDTFTTTPITHKIHKLRWKRPSVTINHRAHDPPQQNPPRKRNRCLIRKCGFFGLKNRFSLIRPYLVWRQWWRQKRCLRPCFANKALIRKNVSRGWSVNIRKKKEEEKNKQSKPKFEKKQTTIKLEKNKKHKQTKKNKTKQTTRKQNKTQPKPKLDQNDTKNKTK